jgi:hypothetical protein
MAARRRVDPLATQAENGATGAPAHAHHWPPTVTDCAALAATVAARACTDAGRLAAEDAADRVAVRLATLGAITELHQLGRLSAQELDVLVEQERRR